MFWLNEIERDNYKAMSIFGKIIIWFLTLSMTILMLLGIVVLFITVRLMLGM